MTPLHIVLAVFVLVIIGVVLVIYRLPTKDAKWTPNEKSTLALGFASIFIAGATLVISLASTETREAVGQLAALAKEAQQQTGTLSRQVKVLSNQLAEQKRQTGYLSDQANAAGQQASAGQASVRVAQLQLATTQAAAVETKRQTAAGTKYQMRLQAMLTYAQGDAAFDTALNQIRDRISKDIEEPALVNKLSPSDLAEIRETADPIAAVRSYRAAVDSSLPAWPAALRQTIVKANNAGVAIAECYEVASMRALNENEVLVARHRINEKCRDLGRRYEDFLRLSKAARVEMQNEVFNAASEVGARPNFPTPDSVRPAS